MKALVTGGAGFIGSHLVEGLVRRGHEVRVFDNLSTGSLDNLAPVRDAVEVVIGDLRDDEAVNRAVEGVEVVFHQAADPSVPRSISHPRDCYDINVLGTLNLLAAARDAGCRRVVFASSCAVYGNDPRQPKSEELPPAPESPYASSKLAGEELCQVFTRVYGLEAVALRYFNVYGPRQSPDGPYASVIPRFIADLKAGARPRVFGDGEQTRDFIFVGDVVEANLRAATASEAVGEVVNVGSGRSTSLNTLLTVLAPLIGNTVEPIYEAERPGDVRHSLAETSKARRLLGFEAQTSLAEGLAQTVRG